MILGNRQTVAVVTLSAVGFVCSALLPQPSVHAQTAPSTPEQVAFFEKNIRPIFATRCADCHSSDTMASAGLRLDDRDSVLKGGRSGPAIVPGDAGSSLLIRRVEEPDPKHRMPKGDEALSPKQISDLRAWIQQGAIWPASTPDHPSSAGDKEQSQPKSASTRGVAYPRPATPEQLAFFKEKVRPIFVNRCYNCHSDAFKEAGGLRVDVGRDFFKGGDLGPVVIPGHPEKSLVIQRVKSANPKKRMPQESKQPLPADEIATLEKWIADGAAWPDETEKLPPTPARVLTRYKTLRTAHWAWQPVTDPKPPVVDDAWATTDVDRFVLAKLREKKLSPVADAHPQILVRRLSYDLTGLPPSDAEVKAFLKDHSEKAYETLVDRYLASPQFGERWGRHWLDVARYAESSGPSRNMPYPNAWRYRDYVIDAYNRDLPYNRFVQEQLAGDLLPSANPAERDRQLIATGFLALGPKDVNQRFKARFKMDNVDDQIDTVTRSTLGLTVSCARCHDHKFDPIPTTDYYALAGIFTSTDDAAGYGSRMGGASLQYYEPKLLGYLSSAAQAPPVSKELIEKLKAEADAQKKIAEPIREKVKDGNLTAEQRKQYAEIIMKARRAQEEYQLVNDLGERGYAVHSARDGSIGNTTVRIRGVEERHGPEVPRGFLSVVHLNNTPTIPANHSGRLELAQWITDPANPLTARVYVNRVWEHLFGTGIVSTVDNFGSTGDQPSNQALLDYLAHDFVQGGWSTKRIVRKIVLTHSYRLGTEAPTQNREIDPADRYVWRHAPRRLEAEEIRDSILASSGQLDLSHPQGSPSMALRMIEIRDDGPVVESILASADLSRYRSIYLPLLRGETPRQLAAFDPVTQTLVTGKREETTVPSQALFLLDSPFVRRQSLHLADTLLSERRNDSARIREAFERILEREPTASETARVKAFLAQYGNTWQESHHNSAAVRFAPVHAVTSAEPSTRASITQGIVRSDDLNQDDSAGDNPRKAVESGPPAITHTAQQAAWTAFVQALYGSAEFQFVR